MKQHAYAGLAILMLVLLAGCNGADTRGVSETQSHLKTAKLLIEGMTCQSCALGVEYELKQVNGVLDANVDYHDGTGLVRYDPAQVEPETIARASTTYPARVIT